MEFRVASCQERNRESHCCGGLPEVRVTASMATQKHGNNSSFVEQLVPQNSADNDTPIQCFWKEYNGGI